MSKDSKFQAPGASETPQARHPFQVRPLIPLGLAIAASALLMVSLRLPLWQMRLEAPQYRGQEALHISVYPHALRGDLHELKTLDQYIGVHVPPVLPQFHWLPGLLCSGAVLGLVAGLLRRRSRALALPLVTCALAAGLAFAALQATAQIRDIGHRRDQKTVLVGVKDFTPPFLGTSKIAQFTVSSRFGLGAWLIGAALGLQVGAARLSRRPQARPCRREGSSLGSPSRLMAEPAHSS